MFLISINTCSVPSIKHATFGDQLGRLTVSEKQPLVENLDGRKEGAHGGEVEQAHLALLPHLPLSPSIYHKYSSG